MDAMRQAHALLDGSPGAIVGHENRERVREYLLAHLGCTNIEIAAALGLSVTAVGRHVDRLRQEWVQP